MKTKSLFTLSVASVLLTSCSPNKSRTLNQASTPPAPSASPLSIVLALQPGDARNAAKIAGLQKHIREGKQTALALEQLGWVFVSEARISFDPGYFKLAEQCGLALDTLQPRAPESLLLRGYALQNLHRFKQAEPLARELVAKRGRAFDYGLLGDVLMEQGRLEEAVSAYQQMADLKPDLQAYTRAAHIRWLKGDLEGAMEVMQMAVQAASPREPESAAWVNSRMALYLLQAGNFTAANLSCEAALNYQADYAPALLAQGRIRLAQGRTSEAIASLSLAARINPLPEYLWVLAEALRAGGEGKEASEVESKLRSRGAAADPRTFALYLATRGEQPATAAQLANAELATREDVFTWDARAWALAAQGRWTQAAEDMRRALADGTQDARLFLHAGIIAVATKNVSEMRQFLNRAKGLEQMLLPSERTLLSKYLKVDDQKEADAKPSEQIRLLTSAYTPKTND